MYTRNTQTIPRAINIHPRAGGFVIGAGAILGLCAGLLWTAQGSLMLSYPTESQKGLFISVFWAIFNLGAVVGASVSLGQNYHSEVGEMGLRVWLMRTETFRHRLIQVSIKTTCMVFRVERTLFNHRQLVTELM
jgi:hypothetical protein